jgi:tetratricopeptide (TPR) repeat protein
MILNPRNYLSLLILVVLGVYYPTIFSPFNSLDDQRLVNHLLNQDSFSLYSQFFPGGKSSYYRPLITLTFQFDKYVWGLHESFMHLENILFHLVNTMLVYGISRSLAEHIEGKQREILPFVAAMLFAVHPINTETVNWISARGDLLAASFVYASLYVLLAALKRRSTPLFGLSALFLLCGMLCKESVLFVAPGFLLLLVWKSDAAFVPWRQRWTLTIFMLISLAIYFIMRWLALHQDAGVGVTMDLLTATTSPAAVAATSSPTSFPLLDAIRVVLKATGFYSVKLVQPLPLNFAIVKISQMYILPGLAVVATLPFLLLRRRPVGVIYLLALLAGIAALLVIFVQSAWTPIAERYMYIPCGFFVMASVYAGAALAYRYKVERIAMVLVIVLFASSVWATASRNIIWQDNLTLYHDTVSKSPDFSQAKNELAMALLDQGRTDESNALMIVNRTPAEQRSSLNQAVALAKENRYNDARSLLVARVSSENDIELKSRTLDILVSLSLEEAGKMTNGAEQRRIYLDIIAWLEQLHKLTNSSFQWYRMGRVYLLLHNKIEAQRCFAKAAIELPKNSQYKESAAKLAKNLGK